MCSTERIFWEKSKKNKEKCTYWISESITLPYDFIRARLHQERFPIFYGTAISLKISKRLHLRNLYVFSKLNIYFYAEQWQLSKFTHRNTVTTFRTLVKPYKGLKRTKTFTYKQQKCWSEKFHKIQPKETMMKSLFR